MNNDRDYIVLVVGQDFRQLDNWMENKRLEVGDNHLYKPKERKLIIKHDSGDTIYYACSKTQDYRNLQGFRGHYVIFLEGDYSSELINTAVYRNSRRGLINDNYMGGKP